MKKIIIFSAFVLMAFVACNNKNNSTTAAPPTPSNQCLMTQTTVNPNVYNNGYGYNNGYYNGYNYNNYANTYNNGTTCSNQIYNDYAQYGFAIYPYNNGFMNYGNGYSYMPLCDCPVNYRPVYNGTIGMGCVAIQYFNPVAVGAYYWSLTPNNYQWVNWTQVSNTTTVVGNQSNCYQQVAISCFTDQANTCGSGYVCRATAGGSRLGICVQQ